MINARQKGNKAERQARASLKLQLEVFPCTTIRWHSTLDLLQIKKSDTNSYFSTYKNIAVAHITIEKV